MKDKGFVIFIFMFYFSLFSFIYFSYVNGAESNVVMIEEEFEGTSLKDGWSYLSQDPLSKIEVKDGALEINNVSGATELYLPSMDFNDYVIKFHAKRISGDTSFSVKYRIQDNTVSNEIKINVLQRDVGTPDYYGRYLVEGTGLAAEYREVKRSNVTEGENISLLCGHNFFYEEIAINKIYEYKVIVNDNQVSFYIDGILILNEKMNNAADGGKICLRTDGNISIRIHSLYVYGIKDYAENLITDIGEIKTNFTDEEIVECINKYSYAEMFCEKYLTPEEVQGLYGYVRLKEAETELERLYSLISSQLPVITVNGSVPSEVNAGSTLILPPASAIDKYANLLKVTVEVSYNGKYLLIKNNSVTLAEKGNYNIVYRAKDCKGKVSERTYTLNVV